MSEPVQYKFEISSKTADCTQLPKDPKKDACEITVYKDNENPDFKVNREGSQFTIAKSDQARIKKAYPDYRVPVRELKDFVQISRDFYDQFGDKANPTPIVNGIQILNANQIFTIVDSFTNFIAHGTLSPKSEVEKKAVERVIANLVATYADPTMGTLVEKVLKNAGGNSQLSPEAKHRIDWIENIQIVRRVFWNEMKPKMDQSVTLSDNLKKSSFFTLIFLMANHILADKGYAKALFTQHTREVAQKHHELMSQIDPNYTVVDNYYAYMATVLKAVKSKAVLKKEYQGDFTQRINVAIQEFEKEAVRETKRLLPQESPVKALKISLQLKYGSTPERKKVLEILLKHVKVQVNKGNPTYVVPMSTIDNEIRSWVRGLDSTQRPKAKAAILYIIDQTLEQNEKMEAFWNGKEQKVPSFYGAQSFGKSLLGRNNLKQLQELVSWAKGTPKRLPPLNPDGDTHVPFRQWTFIGELGVGALGIGTGFIPYSDPKGNYYGHGASFILGGSGLGAAGGNALSYALNMDDYDWAFDVGGAVVGGLLSGLIYGLTTTKPGMMPGPNPDDPGRRNPVDPYGP